MPKKASVKEKRSEDIKTLRKEYLRHAYQLLDVDEVIQGTDEEFLMGYWRPTRTKWVGLPMLAKHYGAFRRRREGATTFEDFVAAKGFSQVIKQPKQKKGQK